MPRGFFFCYPPTLTKVEQHICFLEMAPKQQRTNADRMAEDTTVAASVDAMYSTQVSSKKRRVGSTSARKAQPSSQGGDYSSSEEEGQENSNEDAVERVVVSPQPAAAEKDVFEDIMVEAEKYFLGTVYVKANCLIEPDERFMRRQINQAHVMELLSGFSKAITGAGGDLICIIDRDNLVNTTGVPWNTIKRLNVASQEKSQKTGAPCVFNLSPILENPRPR